jgi:hypothetical protein
MNARRNPSSAARNTRALILSILALAVCVVTAMTLQGCATRERVRVSLAEGSWDKPLARAKVTIHPAIWWIGSWSESGTTDSNGSVVLRPSATEGHVLTIDTATGLVYNIGIGSIERLPIDSEAREGPELLVRIVRLDAGAKSGK